MARAMVLLAGEYELARRLSLGARETAEALGWERELDRLDASYREVCERGAAPASGEPIARPEAHVAAPLLLGQQRTAVVRGLQAGGPT
jgi:hypothetical protein